LIQSFVYLMNAGFCCQAQPAKKPSLFHRSEQACQEGGTIDPVTQSMVIHPSLSEVVAWIIGNMAWAE
ncbi:MAG: hypothetical protein SCM11_09760, partial [Bacillota bacterium]|nr:hypothetical protein [Bacillota bacterium]